MNIKKSIIILLILSIVGFGFILYISSIQPSKNIDNYSSKNDKEKIITSIGKEVVEEKISAKEINKHIIERMNNINGSLINITLEEEQELNQKIIEKMKGTNKNSADMTLEEEHELNQKIINKMNNINNN